MAQYYYDKYNIDYYWDEISPSTIASRIMDSNISIETAVSGDSVTVDSGWYNYDFIDGFTAVVESITGGYNDYILQVSGNEPAPEAVHAGDVYYREREYDYVLGRAGFWKWQVYEKIEYVDSFGTYQYTIKLQVIGEITLEEYTIYQHRRKGSYIETIVADDGTYPDDGISGSYWFIKTTMPVVLLSSIGNKAVNEGQILSFQVSASIDGTSTISYTATGLPTGATFNTNTGEFSWATNYYDEGTYNVIFTAAANGSTDSEAITITVNHVDINPSIDPIGNKTVDENVNLNFNVNIMNPDNVSTTLSATGLPTGATFNTNTGEFSWKPTYLQSGSYDITFEIIYGTTGTDSETVTITINEIHQPPTNRTPIQNYETNDRRPYFEFILPANYEIDNYKYHARLRISSNAAMNGLEYLLESKDDQSNWELWDGSGWIEFPIDGVPTDSKVRATPPRVLGFSFWYWDCASWEVSYGYGLNSSVRKINILISTEEPYVLAIGANMYNCYSIQASETSNGEIGSISFVVNNNNGEADNAINYGDAVILAINDDFGNQEQFRGKARYKNPNADVLQIQAITGGGILSERRVKESYPVQDIGLTQKQVIDTYCSPLTSNNINTNTGIIAPVSALDKTPLRVFEEIRRQYGIYYFVDANWDVNSYLPDEIGSYNVQIRRGD